MAHPTNAGSRTSSSAIVAFVLGLAGWTVIPVVGGILAVVFGVRARREIMSSGGALTGRGLATAGFVLGWVSLAMTALTLIVFLGMSA